MTDIRQDLAKTATELAETAKEAAYVAIGLTVLGFHSAQVRRRELAEAASRANHDLEGSLGEARKEVAKRVQDLDATVTQLIEALDSSLEPVLQRLPEPAQAVFQQAKQTRDQVRTRLFSFAA